MAVNPVDDSLIKLARSLDQSSADSVPNTLSKLWSLLSKSISSSFHAPEELVLRWLLKNMNGSAETAELFRRYPLTWSIMSCLFQKIPLTSLAKSLADRRFVPILQQTLNEISKPNQEPSTDVEMVDAGVEHTSKKRKRSSDVQFKAESLKSARGCLKTAECLLGSLKSLLQLLDPAVEGTSSSCRMGTEHVKSLLCLPTKESAALLCPILSICDIVLQEQETEPFENQGDWLATFNALWNLHLQSSGDAAEVAMSLYPTGCIVMAKLDRSNDLVLDPIVKHRWARDLRRFFTKNMILPARAAFLNRKDIGIFKMAVDVTSFMPTASCPVLFNLAARMTCFSDDAIARKDHEDWTQKVFDIVEEPIRNADTVKRNQAMKVVLDTAIESKASISLSSLRTVCRQHTRGPNNMDLNLVVRIAKLDVDTFLISKDGLALLDDIFKQINSLKDSDFVDLTETNPADLIQLLAKGHASGRDLIGFLQRWFDSLAECLGKGKEYSSISKVWSSRGVIETVSSLLQSSVNTRQLTALLDWLEDKRNTSNTGALLVVLDAISQGIVDEGYVDAIGTRLYDMISQLKLKSVEDSSRARWWRILAKTISWSPLDQIKDMWKTVASDLKKILRKGDLQNISTMAAFECCNRFWLANFRGGAYESDAAELTCLFSKRLRSNKKLTAAEGLLEPLLLSQSPKVVGFAAEVIHTSSTDKPDSMVRSVVLNENLINESKYGNGLIHGAIDVLAEQLAKNSSWDLENLTVGLQTLLELHSEAFSREQREAIAPKLLQLLAAVHDQDLPQPLPLVSKLLSLMIKIMSRPTFYEGMQFANLAAIGDAIAANFQRLGTASADSGTSSIYSALFLYGDLASVTLKQMTCSWESRERGYFAEIVPVVSGWKAQDSNLQTHRLILLNSLMRAVESSKVAAQCQEVVNLDTIRQLTSSLFVRSLSAVTIPKTHGDVAWSSDFLHTSLRLVALEQTDAVDHTAIKDHLRSEAYEEFCNELCERGFRAGWRLKELMFLHFGGTWLEPLDIPTGNIFSMSASGARIPLCARADTRDIRKYIGIVLKNMDEDKRDSHLSAITSKIQDGANITGALLIIHQILEENDPFVRACVGKLDLEKVHTELADRLASTQDPTEFALIAQTLCTLLDKKPSSMKQWNVELTLSIVSTMCSTTAYVAENSQSSAKRYGWMCRLVEIIIKRHRLRLEGHFHLLITALQALLYYLIARPSGSIGRVPADAVGDVSLNESQAKLFSRLLTLVCEPSVASVTRGQPAGLLDSATDAAKRSAGQHMYLVLIAYVKLQLEHAVSRVVREALQPGIYSILDITTHEGRRILNEAVDGSGRAIFKEMYRGYVKFGKWSGI